MWWAIALRALFAGLIRLLRWLPGVKRLLEVRWRTEQTTRQGHEAADKAERLIESYRRMGKAGR